MHRSLLIAFISSAIVISFASLSKKDPKYPTPGVIQIDESLYMDETEVTNFHWLEYLYWIRRTYGDSSKQYKAALPDVTLWKNEPEHQDKVDYYLRYKPYRDYPVVGLTYQQMCDYCIWRSDRVFEYLLIREGLLKFDTTQSVDHHFTISNYFDGKYGGYKTGQKTPPIPHYYLPSEAEWKKAEAYTEKIFASLTKRQMKHSPAAYYQKIREEYAYFATYPVAPDKKYEVKGALYNLHTNVSEQLADSTKVAGDNWKGTRAISDEGPVFLNEKPSLLVGFRCAFRWK